MAADWTAPMLTHSPEAVVVNVSSHVQTGLKLVGHSRTNKLWRSDERGEESTSVEAALSLLHSTATPLDPRPIL